jgi:hypothetical protein
LIAVLMVFVAGSHANAQVEEGQWMGEILGGNYAPGPDDVLDDESTFGLRVVTMLTPKLALVGSLSTVNFEDTVTDGATTVNFDTDILLVDFTAGYVFRPDKRVNIALGGGIGGAFSSTDGTFTTPTVAGFFEELDESSFTLNAAAGPVIHLTRRVYLKPLMRVRWFENREDDETDVESTLAVGFKFGGGR